MLKHPEIDPVAFHILNWPIHWYGLMYLISFVLVGVYLRWRLHQPALNYQKKLQIFQTSEISENHEDINNKNIREQIGQRVDDIIFYAVLGVVLGGRLGFIIFYQFDYYLKHPFDVLKLWQGGMSFHGGLLGVIVALWIYARQKNIRYLHLMDFLAPAVPIGLCLGRLGNFINGELWGRIADKDLPWAMVFRFADAYPRHPSQLYQMAVEGVLLFVVLFFYERLWNRFISNNNNNLNNNNIDNNLNNNLNKDLSQGGGHIAGAFLLFYGMGRIFTEFFREPDYFLGFKWGLTMGQWLSIPMIMAGLGLISYIFILKNIKYNKN